MARASTVLRGLATVTERGQTTVPAAFRKMLSLGKGDRIVFQGMSDGTVVLARHHRETENDPAIGAFLTFLEKDLEAHPERIGMLTAGRLAEARTLVEGVEVDLDKPLPDGGS